MVAFLARSAKGAGELVGIGYVVIWIVYINEKILAGGILMIAFEIDPEFVCHLPSMARIAYEFAFYNCGSAGDDDIDSFG